MHMEEVASDSPSRGRVGLLRTLIFAALVAGPALAVRVGAEDLPDPGERGPYPVGVTTIGLQDWSRLDEKTGRPRSLLTEIWYPATDDARDLPRNKFSDFMLGDAVPEIKERVREFLKVDVAEVDKRFVNDAVRDARVRDGKFPLVVFSHGNGGIRSQSTFWCEHVASHGYVVVSCDHTGNCAATVVDGKVVPFNPGQMVQAAKTRPLDAIFLIDQMERMAGGMDSRFNGRVDMERIGMAGHSFGGFTSAAVIDRDPRVDAILPMTPVWPARTNFTTPVMIFLGTEDKTIGLHGNRQVRNRFEESRGPAYLVELVRGGHFTFSDIHQLDPDYGDGVGTGVKITTPGEPIEFIDVAQAFDVVNSYSVAFLGLYVKGQEGYRAYLEKNHYDPAEVIYLRGGAETASAGQAGE